jgi:rhodanese-related sulfurtransferase
MTEQISAQALQDLINGKLEFALFDIREHREFLKGHLWLAINVPYNTIENRIGRYVPRLDTKIVLIDQNQRLAAAVASDLETIGYSNVCVLGGGFDHWQQAGLPAIAGDYVLAHAFGLYVNQLLGTPQISADNLMQKLQAGQDILIVDSRDPGDYRDATLPGALNVPIAELVCKISDLITDESTQIVVHCGGVTRAVLGAQTLIEAKLANPVSWLVEGTTGWCISGGELCRGREKTDVPASKTATSYAAKTARDLAKQWDLVYLEPAEIEDWISDNPQRTCYLIDVRSREEFLSDTYANANHIPGGELVGMTQDHIATYNARLCLIGDADTARTEITAAWMLKNGWDDIVILKNWGAASEAGYAGKLSAAEAADDSSSMPTDKPEPPAMSQLQASVDIRQHIFKSFMQDHPYSFNLQESKPPGG